MTSSLWQKQPANFETIVWVLSAVISTLLIIFMLLLGYSIEVAGIFFLVGFALLRIFLAYIFKNRFGNALVRVLKFDYEEVERDFRIMFKNKHIRFYRITEAEEDSYGYEFPGHNLIMLVQPYWVQLETASQPMVKVTLKELTKNNEEFAEMLAGYIDEMADKQITPRNKI